MRKPHCASAAAALFVVAALALPACTLKDDAPAVVSIPPPPDVAAPPKDAHVTASGLASKILRVGISDIHPSPRSNVTVLYTGWTTDGKMFETTEGKGPIGPFPLAGSVIPGWVEGLQLMVVGEKRRFWIPATLAYNNDPTRPQGMLVFDIELIAVR